MTSDIVSGEGMAPTEIPIVDGAEADAASALLDLQQTPTEPAPPAASVGTPSLRAGAPAPPAAATRAAPRAAGTILRFDAVPPAAARATTHPPTNGSFLPGAGAPAPPAAAHRPPHSGVLRFDAPSASAPAVTSAPHNAAEIIPQSFDARVTVDRRFYAGCAVTVQIGSQVVTGLLFYPNNPSV